jgi:hypothetical protein
MRKLLAAVTMAATAYAALPAFAASDADCRAMWAKADVNHDGVLSDAEAMRYAAAMRVRQTTMPAEGKLTQAAFMDACKADVYATATPDPGATLEGANSFTEGQAKDRAMARGATDIGPIAKYGDGVWRGPAKLDGKSIQVAVDYKGNVAFQPTH